MLFLLSLVVRVPARLLVLPANDEATKELEVLVLQQQLRVLRRQAGRPRFTALDRVLLAAASRALPRQQGTSLSWSRPKHCCAGTENSCDAIGPTATSANPAGHQSTPSSSRWCCGCQGEPALGLRADLRGAAQASDPSQRHDHQDAAATPRPRPGAAAHRTDLDAVPTSPSRWDRRLRLLHGGDDPAQEALRVVLHPAQHQAGRHRRGHGAP
jgi:hypothetical protein